MITRTFPGRYSSLEPLSQFVIEQATASGLSEAEIYGIQLAVDEAATNIIEHGYGGEGEGEIICQCESFQEGLRVILKDHVQPFHPE
ncbi:MAG: ATP-binding protein, partial [Chloroflexota bacterium]